ncbi:MAG: permease [Promethearchaeota archaeon]
MVNLLEVFQGALESAALTLFDYLSLHVLLCLIPAFFIAGAMAYFIPKDVIIRYMGKDADPKIAYPMATAAGFLLAVCSCTVLPLFVSIWKRGAGLGPAITFLFVAPAINILALTYTGTLIGLDIAIARGFLAIIFAIMIGLIMAKAFGSENDNIPQVENPNNSNIYQTDYQETSLNRSTMILIILLGICAILMAILDNNMIETSFLSRFPIARTVFQTPATIQTIIFLAGLCILLLITSYIPNEKLLLFLWLVYILMTGTSQIQYFTENVQIFSVVLTPNITNMIAKLVLTSIVTIGLILFILRKFKVEDINSWLMETWFFVKSIFPLIIIGVTVAGFIKFFIPNNLIVTLVGQNTVAANLIAVLFGVFMYFPTLMEVPIAKIFLDLGMAKGPLLAYLLADPELSIQSILVTRKFLGDKKNTVFVGLVTIFSTIAGLLFGFLLGQGASIL